MIATRRFLPWLCSCLLLPLAATGSMLASADAPAAKPSPHNTDGGREYLRDRERGWHWYETVPDAPAPPATVATPSKTTTPEEEPEPFSVAWLKKHLEETKIKAIDHPTRENVELYNYLQKIALDRAEKFAQMTQQVNTLNPSLDETIDNPVTSYATTARRDVTSAERKQVLSDLGQQLGIFYFFKSDCPYCAKQTPLLKRLTNLYGYRVMPVSLDRKPLLDGSYPEWVPDRGQGAMLGISNTPTLYLFHPPNTVVLLSVGLQTQPDLESKILQVSHAHKWITDADFEKAVRGRATEFLLDNVLAMQQINWDDPAAALSALREASHKAVEESQLHDEAHTFLGTPWTGTPNTQ